VPHLDVYALDTDLAGREEALIEALTEAVAGVYGEWARPVVAVRLFGLPANRWGIGGRPSAASAPTVTFGIRADVLERPDSPAILAILAGLAAGVTDALAGVLGSDVGDAVTVEFVGRSPDRVAVGGKLGG
jgi:phenylpyruvate tautomerase PptA (4-oxalocrotonate tautomerase family)